MVEVAGGATMSLIYEGLLKEAVPGLSASSIVVMIVCGGCSSSGKTDFRIQRFYRVVTRVKGDICGSIRRTEMRQKIGYKLLSRSPIYLIHAIFIAAIRMHIACLIRYKVT
jgi:hypothetical protein